MGLFYDPPQPASAADYTRFRDAHLAANLSPNDANLAAAVAMGLIGARRGPLNVGRVSVAALHSDFSSVAQANGSAASRSGRSSGNRFDAAPEVRRMPAPRVRAANGGGPLALLGQPPFGSSEHACYRGRHKHDRASGTWRVRRSPSASS